MLILNVVAVIFLFSGSLGQSTDVATKTALSSNLAPQAGGVNTRILGSGFGSLISTGFGIANGIAQGLGVANTPGSFGAFNQPQAINFGRPGHGQLHGGRPDGFGGGLIQPGSGIIGNGFNRPVAFDGNFGSPGGFGGNFNRPGNFGGNFNRPGGFGGNFNRPGNFGGNFNRPGSFGGNFNRPGSFGGNLHQGGFNRPGTEHQALTANLDTDPVNAPGALGFPFKSSLSKLGTCPPVRPVCPGNTRFGPVKCQFDLDCPTGEKCCPDSCLEFRVCKKSR